jgi:hypothetical protein
MKTIRLVQVVWATTLVAVFAALSLKPPGNSKLWFLLLAVIYLVACIRAWGTGRVAWSIAVVVPAVICVLWLPMVAVNLIAFVRGDPPYRDSPATILVVAAEGLVFAIPSLLLVALFWRHRGAIQNLLVATSMGAA